MKTRFILILLVILTEIISFSQKPAVIRNVDFSLIDNKLVITYEIANYKENDRFNIKAEIFKASGEKINAKSFTGDLEDVTKVTGNTIIWDIDKDNIILDDDIYVVVSGEVISAPIPKQNVKIPEKTTEPPPVIKKSPKTVKKTAYFFESLIFPGWGTSKLTGNNIHFLKGFIGYGLVAGSVLTGISANNTYYDEYLNENNPTTRNSYYNDARRLNTYSKVFAGAAAAVWSVDLITVLATRNKAASGTSAGISYHIGYSYVFGNSQLTCRVKF